MNVKRLKELLSEYDDNVKIYFWTFDGGYYDYQYIDDDFSLEQNRIDICIFKLEGE